MMRFFEQSDLREGLTIYVPQRHRRYHVDAINETTVEYTAYNDGEQDGWKNSMDRLMFVGGMEEVFAQVDD